MNFKCLECGEEHPEGSKFYHLTSRHGMTKSQYRVKHGIKMKRNPNQGFQPGTAPHNKKCGSPVTEVGCHICGAKFFVETRQYHHRLRKGKNRFACSRVCVNKLKSLTIKEVRSTLASRAKTTDQANKRWADPAERARYGALMRAKPAEWHSRRMAATLKTCLSGKMTKPEKMVQAQLGDEWEYVGNGARMIGGLNPDFIHKTKKEIVEVFGCYWHGCQKCFPGSKAKGIPLNQRLTTFAKYGYDCRIIWSHELA